MWYVAGGALSPRHDRPAAGGFSPRHFTLTLAGGFFSVPLSADRSAPPLTATLPYGARTFLPVKGRSPDALGRSRLYHADVDGAVWAAVRRTDLRIYLVACTATRKGKRVACITEPFTAGSFSITARAAASSAAFKITMPKVVSSLVWVRPARTTTPSSPSFFR